MKGAYKKIALKIIWSFIILLIVISSKNIDSKYTNEFNKIVIDIVNYDLDLKDKRILNIKKAITSFNITDETMEYKTPIEGTLYKSFGETKTGIDVLVYEEFVRAIGTGEVINTEKKEDGIEIIVSHGDIKAVYSNLEKLNVRKGEKVIKGHILGSMGDISRKNKYFHFEIWKDKKRVDPLKYIKSNDKTPLSYE